MIFNAARNRRKVIQTVGEKLGLVYFGSVDQHTDEHKVVRGFSVSPSHRDSHYMVGSYEGFDVTFVDRRDRDKRWFICQFDLEKDLIPHFFLLPIHHKQTHYEKVFRALRSLEPMELSQEHSTEFKSRYEIFFSPEHTGEMEALFQPAMTQTLAAHFWPLAVEVWDGSMMIYSAEEVLTTHHIETIIKNGTWLAQVLTLREKAD